VEKAPARKNVFLNNNNNNNNRNYIIIIITIINEPPDMTAGIGNQRIQQEATAINECGEPTLCYR
jgi:hypothetical protein